MVRVATGEDAALSAPGSWSGGWWLFEAAILFGAASRSGSFFFFGRERGVMRCSSLGGHGSLDRD